MEELYRYYGRGHGANWSRYANFLKTNEINIQHRQYAGCGNLFTEVIGGNNNENNDENNIILIIGAHNSISASTISPRLNNLFNKSEDASLSSDIYSNISDDEKSGGNDGGSMDDEYLFDSIENDTIKNDKNNGNKNSNDENSDDLSTDITKIL